MAKKCARTFSIVVEKGKKSILDVGHLLPDALPRSVRGRDRGWIAHFIHCPDAATPPFAPTRRRRAPKSATEGGMEVRTARDAWGGG